MGRSVLRQFRHAGKRVPVPTTKASSGVLEILPQQQGIHRNLGEVLCAGLYLDDRVAAGGLRGQTAAIRHLKTSDGPLPEKSYRDIARLRVQSRGAPTTFEFSLQNSN
jgi:hypothetical protein